MQKNTVVSDGIQPKESATDLLLLINSILNEYFPEFKIKGSLKKFLDPLPNLSDPSIQKCFDITFIQQLHYPFILEIMSILHYLKKNYQCWHQACIVSNQKEKEHESALLLLRLATIYKKITQQNSKTHVASLTQFVNMLDTLNQKVIIPNENIPTRFILIVNVMRDLSLWLQKKIIRNGRNNSWDDIDLSSRRTSLIEIELVIPPLNLLSLESEQNIPTSHQSIMFKWHLWLKAINQFCLTLWADCIDFIRRTQLGPLQKWIGIRVAEKKRCNQVIQAYQAIYLAGCYDPNSQLPYYLNLNVPFKPVSSNIVGSYINLERFPFFVENTQDNSQFVQKQIKSQLLPLSQGIYWACQDLLSHEPLDGAANRTLSGIYQSILQLHSREYPISKTEYSLKQLLEYLAQLQTSTFLSHSTSDRSMQTIFFNIKKNASNIIEYIQYEHSNNAQEKAYIHLCKLRTSAYLFLWDIVDSVLILCSESFELRKFNLSTYLNLSQQDDDFQEALNETYLGHILKAFYEELESENNNSPNTLGVHAYLTQHPKVLEHSMNILRKVYLLFKFFEKGFPILDQIIKNEEIYRLTEATWMTTYKKWTQIILVINSEITDDFSQLSECFNKIDRLDSQETLNTAQHWKAHHLDEYTIQFHYTEYRSKLDILLRTLLDHFSKNQFSIKVSQDSQEQYKQLILNLKTIVHTVEPLNPVENMSGQLLDKLDAHLPTLSESVSVQTQRIEHDNIPEHQSNTDKIGHPYQVIEKEKKRVSYLFSVFSKPYKFIQKIGTPKQTLRTNTFPST